jgi:hypothetical protein
MNKKQLLIIICTLFFSINVFAQSLPKSLDTCTDIGHYKTKIGNTYLVISNYWQAPVNLGLPINTLGWEDSPFISPDGNTLYFTYFRVDPITAVTKQKIIITGPERPNWPSNIVGPGGAEIYVSKKINGFWQEPQNIGKTINKPQDFEGDEWVSAAGNEILFTIGEGKAERPRGMHYSQKTTNGWQESQLATNIGFPFLPTDENPHITLDGHTLFFQSNRAGGYGKEDIWLSKNINGRWTQPENLGREVNTAAKEGSPVSLDGKILFFESEGGIYASKKLANGKWSNRQIIVTHGEGSKVVVGDPAIAANGDLYFIAAWQTASGAWNADIMYAKARY